MIKMDLFEHTFLISKNTNYRRFIKLQKLGKTDWRTNPVIIFLLLSIFFFMGSCTQNKEKYIKVDDYRIMDYNPKLFRGYSKKRVIQMKCSSNFPPETVILVKKELKVRTIRASSSKKYRALDTIILKQNTFEVPFSPSFFGGEFSFTVLKSMQNKKIKELLKDSKSAKGNSLYYINYSTGYNIVDNAASPEESIKLIIDTWD